MENNMKTASFLLLTDQQEQEYVCKLKIGLIKELYKKGLISSYQMSLLIKMQLKRRG
ncbi:MAG: hypothetical protein N2Z65_06950 [Clostridiales bacterium]|nr:hypothetical protein [Clostridiales bacterium]